MFLGLYTADYNPHRSQKKGLYKAMFLLIAHVQPFQTGKVKFLYSIYLYKIFHVQISQEVIQLLKHHKKKKKKKILCCHENANGVLFSLV